MRRTLLLAILLSSTAPAAERTVGVGSFDRVRVDGALDVRIATGRSPRATLSGDARTIEAVDVRVEGNTLYVRRRAVAASMRPAATPVVVMLSASSLAAAALTGSGKLAVTGMRGARVDLSVQGSGTIAAEGLDAEQANALVVGGGAITLAGRASRVRLATTGPGKIDAAGLAADDLVVRSDGAGEVAAQARYLASVTTTGAGRIAVTGNAKCTVRAPAGGAVTCGK